MSLYYMQNGKPEVRKYNKHGKTKQSYKDQCDINKLLERGAREGGLSHLQRHGARYADFADINWDSLQEQLAEGQQIFNELPAELKREFNQSPGEFFTYVTDPANAERLPELIPKIAERGRFFPRVNKPEVRKEPEPAPQDPEPAPQNPAPQEPDS